MYVIRYEYVDARGQWTGEAIAQTDEELAELTRELQADVASSNGVWISFETERTV